MLEERRCYRGVRSGLVERFRGRSMDVQLGISVDIVNHFGTRANGCSQMNTLWIKEEWHLVRLSSCSTINLHHHYHPPPPASDTSPGALLCDHVTRV